MLDPGQLNRRIQIQQRSSTPGQLGQPSDTWQTLYECWANITVQKSQLLYETAEFVSKVTYRVTIRWTSSVIIEPDMRIVYAQSTPAVTHIYNIEAVTDTDSAHEELVIFAYEVDGEQ